MRAGKGPTAGRGDASGGPAASSGGAAQVEIRELARADLPAILDIERLSFPKPWSRALFERELSTPFARVVVAVVGNRVVGYCCRWRVSDEVHLLNVAVHPSWRGRGIGRKLVEEVIAEARATGGQVIYLEVREGNSVARRLYRGLGFRELGLRRNYYASGEHAVVMELRLARAG